MVGNRNFTRAMRRKTQWGGFGSASGGATLPEEVALTLNVAQIISSGIVIGNSTGVLDEEVTVTRTIGSITVSLDADTALVDATVAVGLAVVRSEAANAGVGSLPSPEDDPDFEWLYYTVLGLKNPQNALRDGPLSAQRVMFDVRGQRIIRSGSSVVWIAECQAANCTAQVSGRYLMKLT